MQGHRSVDNLCKKRRTKERHREKERERGGERKRGRKFLERIYILPHFAVLGTFDALQGAFGGYGSSRRTAQRGARPSGPGCFLIPLSSPARDSIRTSTMEWPARPRCRCWERSRLMPRADRRMGQLHHLLSHLLSRSRAQFEGAPLRKSATVTSLHTICRYFG